MSIYISISTLEDTDIVDTVFSALNNASNIKNIHIGVAATVNDSFYKKFVLDLQKINNVNTKQYDPINDRGIGRGRNNARFAYDNQDYMLQIDSHTLFQPKWDSFITSLYDDCIKETKNNKTVMTGYLGPYYKNNGVIDYINGWPGYCFYTDKNITDTINIKNWSKKPIHELPENIVNHQYRQKKFLPANKIGADFMFGNKNWAEYSGLPMNMIFWEEEVVQSIMLLNSGFSLAYPNVELPLSHRYWNSTKLDRQTADELYDNTQIIDNLINNNINNFIKNNYIACKKYENYCGYDIVSNTVNKRFIPNNFSY